MPPFAFPFSAPAQPVRQRQQQPPATPLTERASNLLSDQANKDLLGNMTSNPQYQLLVGQKFGRMIQGQDSKTATVTVLDTVGAVSSACAREMEQRIAKVDNAATALENRNAALAEELAQLEREEMQDIHFIAMRRNLYDQWQFDIVQGIIDIKKHFPHQDVDSLVIMITDDLTELRTFHEYDTTTSHETVVQLIINKEQERKRRAVKNGKDKATAELEKMKRTKGGWNDQAPLPSQIGTGF